MLFSSPLFLFIFLPASILVYYSLRPWAGNRAANTVLLVFSYLFYLCGAGPFTLILLGSTVADYLLGLLILRRRSADKVWVSVSLTLNIGLLAYFKYANFFRCRGQCMAVGNWPCPGGVDRGGAAHRYFFFYFPENQLYHRCLPEAYPTTGQLHRFCPVRGHVSPIGRRTHCTVQGHLGSIEAAHRILGECVCRFPEVLLGPGQESAHCRCLRSGGRCGLWAGHRHAGHKKRPGWVPWAYSFQIYFDFSAYSDMAIGLARVFGFHLLENFNRPYAARSITDFWRRWHISLSRWFRDYVYIPLGGNRQTRGRTYANLLTVFTLCGLWHGANWTFVCWGLYHGFFLIGERLTGFRRAAAGRWGWIGRPLAFLIVLFGWVLFRADSLPHAAAYARVMAMPLDLPLTAELYDVLHYRNLVFMAVAAVATLGASSLPRWDQVFQPCRSWRVALGLVLIIAVLPYCAAFVMAGAANPFIYFRF
jgi:alginate O-acetyltransferase complex protein AlgI